MTMIEGGPFRARWAAALLLLLAVSCGAARAADGGMADARRVVVIGGSLTEIMFELGLGERIVGVDETSVWPEAAVKALPKVGYMRSVSVEGVASLTPDLVVTFDDVEPKSALDQLRAAGIAVSVLPRKPTVEGLLANIRALADGFGVAERGAALAGRIESDLAALRAAVARRQPMRAVLFLNMGQGPMLVSGHGTVADLVMGLAGADNVAGGFQGYKPFSAETLLSAAPDVLLTTEHGLAAIGGVEGFGRLPGVAATEAYRAGRIVTLDANLLLGIGPRIATGARLLAERLHGAGLAEGAGR